VGIDLIALAVAPVSTIYRSFEAIHVVWANPIEIGIAIWLLQRKLDLGSIGPAVPVLVGTAKLSKLMPRASKTWNEEIQKRITVTSGLLGSIKETKMLGMIGLLQWTIQDLGISELARAKRCRALITYMNMLGEMNLYVIPLPQNTPSMVGPVVTFGRAIFAQKLNAVYSRKPAIVVDDAPSSERLGRGHERSCLERSLGLCRVGSPTRSLDNSDYTLISADNVVILGDDGRIANQGTFDAIRSSTYLENFSIDSNRRDDAISSEDMDPLDIEPPKMDAEIDPEQDLLRTADDTTLYCRSVGGMDRPGLSTNVVTNMPKNFGSSSGLRTMRERARRIVIVPKSSRSMHWTLLQSVMRWITRWCCPSEKEKFQEIDRAPSSFFVSTDTGNLINRFSQDLSHIDRDLPSALFWFMAPIDRYLAVAIPFVLVILYCLQAFYLRTSRQMRFFRPAQAQASLLTKLIETIDGLSTIRAFCWQEAYKSASLDLLDQAQCPCYLLFCIQLITGAVAVALDNALSFNRALAHLIASRTELDTSLGAISRLRTFEFQTPVEPSPCEEESVQPRPHWPAHGQIEITNVTASYSADSRPVLNGVSLSINTGDKIAICGRTGSGTSSLTLAIFKLLSEPLLFPGTLRMNLFPYGDDLGAEDIPSDEALIDALCKVSLWQAISFHSVITEIADLPLSKGQKQLLSFTRAIVRKNRSRVLVLDEATSAVDQETEEMMARIIRAEFDAHTVISVVHRPQALRGLGKIVALHESRVAEIKSVGCWR
ncbi:Canalicular multispecific organic anion transporter 1, partial [Colletotrichum tanaceti]